MAEEMAPVEIEARSPTTEPTSVETGEETHVIDEITDVDVWTRVFEQSVTWVENNVLTSATLVELALIIGAALVAWPASRVLRRFINRYAQSENRYAVLGRLWSALTNLSFPVAWLVLLLATAPVAGLFDLRTALVLIVARLLTAWIIVRLATVFIANAFLAQTIAVLAWVIAALSVLGLLDATTTFLDEATLSLGQVNISALTVIQGVIALCVLLWITALIAQVIEGRLKASPNLTPSVQVLSTKLMRIALGTFAFLSALAIVGVDLTALAVFGGAIGVGLGFGLQKIFANLVSGFILLMDKSIKPGDVIAVPEYYGRVDALGARYVSVTTRDGIEHLIPNEELITTRVENWSHSHNLLRLRKVVGVHYQADVHKAAALCIEAALEVERVLQDPKPVCLLKNFGDSSVDLEIRFWIDDPMNGRANVTSQVLFNVWDKFHEHGIEIPYPQRDLHLRSSDVQLPS